MSERYDWPEIDLGKSARRFVETVYPAIREDWFDGKRLRPQESGESDNELDVVAGVDYWIVDPGKEMWSLASRVQQYPNQHTFTIRYKRKSSVGHVTKNTEYQKRRRSIVNGSHYPDYTLQAYVPRYKQLDNVAYCETKDLYEYLENGVLGEDYAENEVEDKDGSVQYFYIVHWEDFRRFHEIEILSPGRGNGKWRLSDQSEDQANFFDFQEADD